MDRPSSLMELAEELGVADRVNFLAPRPPSELVDVYRLANQPAEADKMARESVAMLKAAAESADGAEQLGHHTDRELAYACLKTNELDKALEHAEKEYKRRPDNIDVNETMAWVHYKRGEYAEAQKYMTVARRTNSQNPVLLGRAEDAPGLATRSLKAVQSFASLLEALRTVAEAGGGVALASGAALALVMAGHARGGRAGDRGSSSSPSRPPAEAQSSGTR